jgi:hypothetical protein
MSTTLARPRKFRARLCLTLGLLEIFVYISCRYNNRFFVLLNSVFKQIVFKSSSWADHGASASLSMKVLCDKIVFVLFKLWMHVLGLIISSTILLAATRSYSSCFRMFGCKIAFSLNRNAFTYNGCRFGVITSEF